MKLTRAEILAIREDVRLGRVIAEEYGCSESTVSLVRRGWRGATEEEWRQLKGRKYKEYWCLRRLMAGRDSQSTD